MWTRLGACLLVVLIGCDEPRPRVDPDFVDGAVGRLDGDVVDGAAPDGRAPERDGAVVADGPVLDGPAPDLERDFDRSPDVSPDVRLADRTVVDEAVPDGPAFDLGWDEGERPDVPVPDEGPADGPSIDLSIADLGEPPDLGPGAFVTGVAHAADHRQRVTVSAGGAEAVADEEPTP